MGARVSPGHRSAGEEGWRVNHKRVERIWRREGLKVPKKQPPRRRLWLTDGSCIRRRAVKLLTIVDAYTWKCLAIDVELRLRSDDVRYCLAELFVHRGSPQHIRSDHGPAFAAKVVRSWLSRVGVQTLFVSSKGKGVIEDLGDGDRVWRRSMKPKWIVQAILYISKNVEERKTIFCILGPSRQGPRVRRNTMFWKDP